MTVYDLSVSFMWRPPPSPAAARIMDVSSLNLSLSSVENTSRDLSTVPSQPSKRLLPKQGHGHQFINNSTTAPSQAAPEKNNSWAAVHTADEKPDMYMT